MNLLRKISLIMALGIAAAAAAESPSLPTRMVNGRLFYYYEVPPKATIYSITRTYGITREDLLKYNPQLIDGLRAGDIIYFPAEQDSAEVSEQADQPEQTESTGTETSTPDRVQPDAKPEIQPEVQAEVATETETPAETADDAELVNVAIMLPFMLDSENMTRHAQNNLNFYRGALLAVDSMASSENRINIFAFDTAGSPDSIAAIIARPEMEQMDYIIAPGDSLAIEQIAATADESGATLINLFAVKNDAHLRHSSVLQANIPHDAMYAGAVKAFCDRYRNHKVILLNATDIPADKKNFTDELTAQLLRSGIPYEQFDYAGKLDIDELRNLPAREYVFIPTSASREALMKTLPSLTEFAETSPETGVTLFGYPEWVVLRGDIKDKLHRLSTTVYSRFSTDLSGNGVAAVNNAYLRNFGSEPTASVPDTMLLGFDTIAWILNVANNGMTTPYTGLQNAFRIIELDDAGDVNEALYLITFTRTGQLNASAL